MSEQASAAFRALIAAVQELTTAINKRNEKNAIGQAQAQVGGHLKTVGLPADALMRLCTVQHRQLLMVYCMACVSWPCSSKLHHTQSQRPVRSGLCQTRIWCLQFAPPVNQPADQKQKVKAAKD